MTINKWVVNRSNSHIKQRHHHFKLLRKWFNWPFLCNRCIGKLEYIDIELHSNPSKMLSYATQFHEIDPAMDSSSRTGNV